MSLAFLASFIKIRFHFFPAPGSFTCDVNQFIALCFSVSQFRREGRGGGRERGRERERQMCGEREREREKREREAETDRGGEREGLRQRGGERDG